MCHKFFLTLVLLVGQLVSNKQAYAQNDHLYLVYKEDNAGDKSQVLGIASALKAKMPDHNFVEETFYIDKQDKLFGSLKSHTSETVIVIASGTPSIDLIEQIKPQKALFIVHSSHQLSDDHFKLKGKAHIIALPQHAVNEQQLAALSNATTTVVTTVGVAHNLSVDAIRQAFEENKTNFPQADTYLGVILGGDAPKPDGEMLYYSPQEAQRLGHYIAAKVKEQKGHLLILNGPRTGKFDSNTGNILETSHRNGHTDPVTTAFIRQLDAEGLKQGKNYTLFDFQYGQPSSYHTVLGALSLKSSSLYVAGESTSMVSEAADCLAKGQVTAFTHQAMNENHYRHCQGENSAGRINLLNNSDERWELLPAKDVKTEKSFQSAAEIIAEAIVQHLKKQ